ncbi:hypothetical protein EI94DRAFT_1786085 [Lactarius quietus]|nr:hypothetical protein EI94DRAFT_1786085 [Lactarius quietus]
MIPPYRLAAAFIVRVAFCLRLASVNPVLSAPARPPWDPERCDTPIRGSVEAIPRIELAGGATEGTVLLVGTVTISYVVGFSSINPGDASADAATAGLQWTRMRFSVAGENEILSYSPMVTKYDNRTSIKR